MYFVLLFHLTKLYGSQNHDFERFILLDGKPYAALFWVVQLGLGSLLPLLLIYTPALKDSRRLLVLACLLVLIGAFAQLYIIIIGGQAFPLNIFPGYIVESSFYDGVINAYSPSMRELLLGLGGLSAALLIALLGLRILPILPEILGPEVDG